MIPESIPPIVACVICDEACIHMYVGDVIHRGIAQLLLGQAALFMKHHQRGHLEKDGVYVHVCKAIEYTVQLSLPLLWSTV